MVHQDPPSDALGDAMMSVAAAIGRVYGDAGVGYVLAVWTASAVLFILFGRVFADRFGARTVMIGRGRGADLHSGRGGVRLP